MIESPIKP